MMFYYVSFVVLSRRGDSVLLKGPENFDIQAEYDKYKQRISEELGPEPSFLEPNTPYMLKAMELMYKLQGEYNCKGDFQSIFIEHLTQRCGFERVTCHDSRLA
jgi:hypothetical protein